MQEDKLSKTVGFSPARKGLAERDIQAALDRLGEILLGKEHQLRLALCCLLARGHLLIEDQPGMGKTTLAHALANVLGLSFKRLQFTSDLLPADIIGVSIYQPELHEFRFHAGPLFAQLVLADEINRATPKTQSALLEAMEENQVTADGAVFPLPEPFFVIATQNPRQHIGTFPLPESQLDRFLMRITLGYPDREAERRLLTGAVRRDGLRDAASAIAATRLRQLQSAVDGVHVSAALLDYVQDILSATRNNDRFHVGLSPRAGLGLVQSARAWALLAGRELVLPEDVQSIAAAVMAHRLVPKALDSEAADIDSLVRSIPIP